MRQLTESERSLVVTSLRVAASRYEENANALSNMDPNYKKLMYHFRIQYLDAIRLAEELENEVD